MPPPTTGASRSRRRGLDAARSGTRRRPVRVRRRPYAQCKNGGVISTSAVDTYIQSNSRRFVDELKELCSFPSISNNGLDAIKPARDWIANRLAGFTDRVETLDAGGMPALYAEVKGAGRRKLLLNEHYDVQPVDPIDQGEADPSKAVEKDGTLVARGVADDKAVVMARIRPVEALRCLGQLSVRLRFLVEGGQEVGSTRLARIASNRAG